MTRCTPVWKNFEGDYHHKIIELYCGTKYTNLYHVISCKWKKLFHNLRRLNNWNRHPYILLHKIVFRVKYFIYIGTVLLTHWSEAFYFKPYLDTLTYLFLSTYILFPSSFSLISIFHFLYLRCFLVFF